MQLIFFAWLFFLSTPHPIHLSVTEGKCNLARKTLEISVKIFKDDLEAAIQQKYQTLVRLEKMPDSLLTRYVTAHLQVAAGNTPLRWKLVGIEDEVEAIWIYLESQPVSSLSSFRLQNRILHELYDDQMNMFHFSCGSSKKSFRWLKNDEAQNWTP